MLKTFLSLRVNLALIKTLIKVFSLVSLVLLHSGTFFYVYIFYV